MQLQRLQRPRPLSSLILRQKCLRSRPNNDQLRWSITQRWQQRRRRKFCLFQCNDNDNNDTTSTKKKTYDSFFGPPQYLQSLPLYQTVQISITPKDTTTNKNTIASKKDEEKERAKPATSTETLYSITRLSSTPVDIFLIKNFVSNPQDRAILMSEAKKQGLEKALGSSANNNDGDHGGNDRRSNSHVAWIIPYDDEEKESSLQIQDNDPTKKKSKDSGNSDNQMRAGRTVATEMTQRAQALFLPSSLLSKQPPKQKQKQKQTSHPSFKPYTPENIQVVKYSPNGKFDLHHDGFSRHVTVLTYVNGVAGTWFPFANLSDKEEEQEWGKLAQEDWKSFWNMVERGTIVEELKLQPGVDGLLLAEKNKNDADVGMVGDDHFGGKESEGNIVHVDAGDAVVFYNYDWYDLIDDDDDDDDDDYADEDDEEDEIIIPPLMNWRTMHAGLEAKEEKWIATNWFRNGFIPYRGG